jgi:hypothetical protein
MPRLVELTLIVAMIPLALLAVGIVCWILFNDDQGLHQ